MKSILFVDDHKTLARLSCEILQMHGYRAECAFDGNQALARFEQDSFDIVVTDFRMEEMNGLELAHRLREKNSHLPIVIVTGCVDVEPSTEVNAWVSKHEMFPKLLDTIDALLNSNTPQEITEQI
jgi:CheY-like chemotaxis protein